MFVALIKYLYSQTRQELHSALNVLVYASAFGIAALCLWLLFAVTGKSFSLNFEWSGYLVGCIGSGELARGLAKLKLSTKQTNTPYLVTSIAGATTIGTFWFCTALEKQYAFWTIPISFIVGGLIYILIELAYKFDKWCHSKI